VRRCNLRFVIHRRGRLRQQANNDLMRGDSAGSSPRRI
jgi:hypothetical protein